MPIIAQANMTGGENVGTGNLAGLKHPPEELHKPSPATKVCPFCHKTKQENEWGLVGCRSCDIGRTGVQR